MLRLKYPLPVRNSRTLHLHHPFLSSSAIIYSFRLNTTTSDSLILLRFQ